jgi:hypothetical protein
MSAVSAMSEQLVFLLRTLIGCPTITEDIRQQARDQIARLASETNVGEWVFLKDARPAQNAPVLMRRTGSEQIPRWQVWRALKANPPHSPSYTLEQHLNNTVHVESPIWAEYQELLTRAAQNEDER